MITKLGLETSFNEYVNAMVREGASEKDATDEAISYVQQLVTQRAQKKNMCPVCWEPVVRETKEEKGNRWAQLVQR